MEKNSIRRSFSLQEAVVLLDTYIEANENGLSLTRTAEKASARLRAIAIRNGESIDDGFRSPAGLLNRIRSIAALYSGTKSESAPGTKAFSEAVVLYREEREEYEKILKAALGDKPAQKQKPAPKVMKRNRATKINKTRFVRNAKDQELIAMYGDSLRATYYALKRLTGNGKENASATDVFVELKKAVQRKVIIEILSAASWAKEVTASHYMFYDAEQEERGRKRMEEQIKANEIAFFQWLPSAVSPFIVNEILDSYVRISTMLLQTKLIPGPLASITTINQIEAAQRQVKRVFGSKKNRNLASKALSAYVSYLREKKNSVVKKEPEPAIDIQENWIKFTFTNAASFERTAPAYCAVAGQIITGKSWARILVELVELEIKKDNPGLSELYKKPLIINRANRPFFLKEQIKGLSCAQVSTGYWINLNYGVPTLLEIIQLFCLQCGYTKNQILIYGVPKSSASAGNGKANESRQSGNRMDILKAEEYLLSLGLAGATVQKLIAAVQPSAAVAPTRKALEEGRNIISMPKNRYVHADAFVDLDEAEEILSEILKTHFAEFGGYSNSILLYGAAALDMSMFLNDNNCDNADSVFSIARFLFEKKAADENPYKFASPHIFETEPDFPLSLKGLMINFARHNGGILNADEAMLLSFHF